MRIEPHYRWYMSLEPGVMPRQLTSFTMSEADAKGVDPTAEPLLSSRVDRRLLENQEWMDFSNTPGGNGGLKP